MTRQIDERLVKIGLPADPVLFDLQDMVGDQAAEWRGTQTDKIVRQYQAILKCLISLDWDGYLLPEDELPEELMPPEYYEYLKRKYSVSESAQD